MPRQAPVPLAAVGPHPSPPCRPHALRVPHRRGSVESFIGTSSGGGGEASVCTSVWGVIEIARIRRRLLGSAFFFGPLFSGDWGFFAANASTFRRTCTHTLPQVCRPRRMTDLCDIFFYFHIL